MDLSSEIQSLPPPKRYSRREFLGLAGKTAIVATIPPPANNTPLSEVLNRLAQAAETPLPDWVKIRNSLVTQGVSRDNRSRITGVNYMCYHASLSMATKYWADHGGPPPLDQWQLAKRMKDGGYSRDPYHGLGKTTTPEKYLDYLKSLGYGNTRLLVNNITYVDNNDATSYPDPISLLQAHLNTQPSKPILAAIERPVELWNPKLNRYTVKRLPHMVLVTGISPDGSNISIADPINDKLGGLRVLPFSEFDKMWTGNLVTTYYDDGRPANRHGAVVSI